MNSAQDPLQNIEIVANINAATDEALKNLMISWYYAGYYTGLYEGQQKPGVTANKSSDKINNPATEGVDSQDASS